MIDEPGLSGERPAERPDADELVSIARIVRPQGRNGEVIADLTTDFPERFAGLGRALIKRAGGEMLSLDLENSWLHKGRVVLKFAGYDDIDTADTLRGASVMITRDQLVRLPDDTYYGFDLIGCDVSTAGGRHLGLVADVQDYGAAPLLAVRDGEHELLIPLAQSICVRIDVAQKTIVVDPPEGLLDL
jgi:16S rRNA processing protein RimM